MNLSMSTEERNGNSQMYVTIHIKNRQNQREIVYCNNCRTKSTKYLLQKRQVRKVLVFFYFANCNLETFCPQCRSYHAIRMVYALLEKENISVTIWVQNLYEIILEIVYPIFDDILSGLSALKD